MKIEKMHRGPFSLILQAIEPLFLVNSKTSRFIHKSSISFLATHYPVHFYWLPNGKVYLCSARFYEAGFNNTDLEFAFASHNYFVYNYN